jgi:hypothetical protein
MCFLLKGAPFCGYGIVAHRTLQIDENEAKGIVKLLSTFIKGKRMGRMMKGDSGKRD